MSLVPPTSCYDGRGSSSIGRQGACSHHGGVNDHGEIKFVIFIGSVGIIILVNTFFLRKKQNIIDANSEKYNYNNNYVDLHLNLIKFAIKEHKSIEFLYKTPNQFEYSKRIVLPIRLVFFGKTQCLVGFCKLIEKDRNFALKRMKDLKIL